MASPSPTARIVLLIDESMEKPRPVGIGRGTLLSYSAPHPIRGGQNQDSALVLLAGESLLLAVADGAGGHRSGALASQTAVQSLAAELTAPDERSVRARILDGFETANHAVRGLGVGAVTTLAVAHLEGNRLRVYHVGDTTVLLTGQRGRLKLQTIDHSPIGYAVEAGLMDADEAMVHEDRHLVSNLVGLEEMHIDIGPSLRLKPRDTLILASDGLFDNLSVGEILELLRYRPLGPQMECLVDRCRRRMLEPAGDSASKPDDLTVLAYRAG